jgi:hypothetical protein
MSSFAPIIADNGFFLLRSIHDVCKSKQQQGKKCAELALANWQLSIFFPAAH